MLEEAALGGGGVTIAGGYQEKCGCETQGRGLVGHVLVVLG